MPNPDKPRDRPTVPDVLPLVRAIYQRSGGSVGCCLHVLIDDGNVEQTFADSAVQLAAERQHGDCLVAAGLLAQMTPTQRRRISRLLYSAE